ncbi:MAG: hypothetical protein A4E48_01567 [Methanosaeta sp. PtaU1.Bin060]|nr:MAG: hypothetical protein A4E48_01567 [Methanosaeta sp. PtaU1.Bin060]
MRLTEKESKAEITAKWDDSSEGYDSQHGHGIRTMEEKEAWINALADVLPPVGSNILDVGCGTGELSVLLAGLGYKVTGIDLSEKMLKKARSKSKSSNYQTRFEVGDAEELKFRDESFDVVINRHLLWTLPQPTRALQEWKRVLKKDGRLIVIDGLWDDGSIDHRLRRYARAIYVLLLERRDPRRGWYSKRINSTLPHPSGMNADQAKIYLESADFQKIDVVILQDLMDIQRKYMPFSQKIAYDFPYYMITGRKDLVDSGKQLKNVTK